MLVQIELSFKSSKKIGQETTKTPAVPAKASSAGPSVTATVSSPAPQRKQVLSHHHKQSQRQLENP